jgi:hypothetical protein
MALNKLRSRFGEKIKALTIPSFENKKTIR